MESRLKEESKGSLYSKREMTRAQPEIEPLGREKITDPSEEGVSASLDKLTVLIRCGREGAGGQGGDLNQGVGLEVQACALMQYHGLTRKYLRIGELRRKQMTSTEGLLHLRGQLETEQVEMWNKHVGIEVWRSVRRAHLEVAIWEPAASKWSLSCREMSCSGEACGTRRTGGRETLPPALFLVPPLCS